MNLNWRVLLLINVLGGGLFGPCHAQMGSEKGRPQPGIRYFHTDHIGSSTLTTDKDGIAVSRLVYLPYGEVLEAASSGPDDIRAKFTGKERDHDSRLYYYGARYYDAQAGRFISADQGLGASANHPAAMNRYSYAGGNPITVTDPTGNRLQEDAGNVYVPPAPSADAGNLPIGAGNVYIPPALPADAGNLPEGAGMVAAQDEDEVVAAQGEFSFSLVPGADPAATEESLVVDATILDEVGKLIADIPFITYVQIEVDKSILPGVEVKGSYAITEDGELVRDGSLGTGIDGSFYNVIGGGAGVVVKVNEEGDLYVEYSVEGGFGFGGEFKGKGVKICLACVELKYIDNMDGTTRVEIEPKASVTVGNVTIKAGQAFSFDGGVPGYGSPEAQAFEAAYFGTFWNAGCAPTQQDRFAAYMIFRKTWIPPSQRGEMSPYHEMHQNQEINLIDNGGVVYPSILDTPPNE